LEHCQGGSKEEEKMSEVGKKNPVLCPRGVSKIPDFSQGVGKIQILSQGVTEIFLPPPLRFFYGIPLTIFWKFIENESK